MSEHTLRPSRVKTIFLFLGCLVFVAGGMWMIANGDKNGYFVAIFFAIGLIVFPVLLLPDSSYLRLTSKGFEARSLFRTQNYLWSDVDRFDVMRITHAGINSHQMVVYNFSTTFNRASLGQKMSGSLIGWEAALPDTYGISAEALAALMNDYKRASERPVG